MKEPKTYRYMPILMAVSAVLGILSSLFLLAHIGFMVFCHLTYFYDPALNLVFALPCEFMVGLHAVCGIISLFIADIGIGP